MPSHLERQFKGVSIGDDDSGDWVYVNVTDRTQTPADALAALVEYSSYGGFGDDFDAAQVVPEPSRSWFKLGGDGEIECGSDDPDRRAEWWRFDISAAWI